MENDRRIEIEPGGPYIVHGDVPLSEMAPVHTFNGEPVDWHTLRELPVRRHPLELCRCGGSTTKPFCDSSHEENGFMGEEAADRLPFMQRARFDRHDSVGLADDRSLCFSAGFCGTRTTDVWKLLEESDDPEKRALMREMIWRCPSGRVAFVDADGNDVEPELSQNIAVLPGGPLWVRGGIPITSADGSQWETRNRVTLCRCGASSNKPFCDGSHATIRFDER